VRAGDRAGGQVNEFKAMVRAMHQAGLEVILDVVFNHTAEGGEGGPSLSFRGLDDTAYYRLSPGHPDQYYDTTGTGNSLNAELGWFTPAGTPMNEDCWNDPEALALGAYLDGSDAPDTGADGQPLLDDDFLVLVNGWWEPLEFTIPDCRPGLAWRAEIDTCDPAAVAAAPVRLAGARVTVGPRSVLVLRGPRVSPVP